MASARTSIPGTQDVRWALINTLQAGFLAAWTAFWISAALVVMAALGRRDVPLVMARLFWGPGLLWASGVRLEVEGGEDVDWSKPHVFAMNHQPMMDVPVAFIALRTPLRFIAKRVLAFVPFLGWYMAATGMVFVAGPFPPRTSPTTTATRSSRGCATP